MRIFVFPKIPIKHIIKKVCNCYSVICTTSYPGNEKLVILYHLTQ